MARYATRKQKTCTKIKKHAKYAVLKSICVEVNEAAKKNGNRNPYGLVKKMLEDMSKDYPWLNRNVINFSYEKYIRNKNALILLAVVALLVLLMLRMGGQRAQRKRQNMS